MKKKYIVPESRLFAINMTENIAAISGASSEISGAAVIQFYERYDGCRGIYTETQGAVVDPNASSFFDYYEDLQKYGAEVYFKCFRYQF